MQYKFVRDVKGALTVENWGQDIMPGISLRYHGHGILWGQRSTGYSSTNLDSWLPVIRANAYSLK